MGGGFRRCAWQICPGRRNVRATAIGKHEHQAEPAPDANASENFKLLALQGVMGACHPDVAWQVSEVGSLS